MHHKGCPSKLINLGTPTEDEEGEEPGWVGDEEVVGDTMGRDHRQLAESRTMANHSTLPNTTTTGTIVSVVDLMFQIGIQVKRARRNIGR